ncbi:FAD-binding and (Fe-S)-binding domain-containing protein [Massilibacteroides sp.]|uniref:FAD-binding and (Fe-S)-binding domain-containing protein n=1 Tax=Massilibacteroides sp. TaxID=2034766 RepID=UPI0026247A79|nr:FAD-binding and (Fe-S)-binding domain-containing protein [Massilibacteroides sp.]MDD4514158.1 FAD-binding and (Fe-S)-binding domain-containing protein [Massilibacteroides sp.]
MNKAEKYTAFLKEIRTFVPEERIYTDELRRLAWGTDASFYRLIPQVVIRSVNEQEIAHLLSVANGLGLPATFRAAGTSLSGQTLSDSILIVAGKYWENYSIENDGKVIRMQPGIIGQRVNEILKPFGRKFSPDPASVKSAMIGGIIINNASGMNCGTHANSDKVLLSARIVFADGTILDTGNEDSRSEFKQKKPDFISKIEELKDAIRSNSALADRIRKKYSIKNVTGLNLLPFVLFDDPFEIIAHLMVGSEGTLAFLSEVTMKTEHDYPHKASAMLYFDDIKEACRAVVAMKELHNGAGEWIVKGAELLDSKSLDSVKDPTGKGLTAVLTETKGDTEEELNINIEAITNCLSAFKLFTPPHFTAKEEEYAPYWQTRSGIFPSVGGTRQPGTTCLIEDVAFPIQHLPEATAELQDLIAQHGYTDGCIYGHALEGNFHFILNQSFTEQTEIDRYDALMNDVIKLVVDKYDGSLKAEHGTGRNMAPFVLYEWGDDAWKMMQEVKYLFDPKNLLNPGVIFNDDPQCHLRNLKPLPLTNPVVDKCIECGFCEINCLTSGFTLSSRQRIIIQREISRLKSTGEDNERLQTLIRDFRYPGNQTCAGDGLCATSCPMHINTGDLTHALRAEELSAFAKQIGAFTADNLSLIKQGLRPVLGLANLAHGVLGTSILSGITRGLHEKAGIPLWTPAMPKAYRLNKKKLRPFPASLKVVYFPSCINQAMGTARQAEDDTPQVNKMISLLNKAGYEVIFPENMDNLCCGTIWESKGMEEIANKKSAELEQALWHASEQGRYPVLCDQSPCLYRMRHTIKSMKLYEPVEFINTFLLDKLQFKQTDTPVSIHVTCSMKKMGLGDQLIALAKRCSTHVVVPQEVGCCGFAGDKGFTHPEVNSYALRKLRPQIEEAGVKTGYSNSRTCEIGLSTNAGIPYVSIIYLVDQCTEQKTKQETKLKEI